MATMKAITVHNPYGWAIIAGHKTVENRSWPTSYRGILAIHSGSSDNWLHEGIDFFKSLGVDLPSSYMRGKIIGVVDLVECAELKLIKKSKRGPHHFGPFCFSLANPRPLANPVPARGMPGMFDVQADQIIDQIKSGRTLF